MRRAWWFLALSLIVLLPARGFADVVNGDFELGGTAWTVQVPANWTADFPPTGGNPNGYASILSPFGNSGGEGCDVQTFQCGNAGQDTCIIGLDYKLDALDANPLSGRVKIYLDGQLMYTSPPADHIPWTAVTFTAPCGTHTIRLCLEVDPGNNGWIAGFDNVSAVCDNPNPVERSTWGRIKNVYD